MHERWINIETNQSGQASIGRATASTRCSSHNTVWWVVALTLVLSGCASGPPPQAYYDEYQANDQTYRYYKTTDQKVLLVSPDGQVAEVTDFVGTYGDPSTREDGQLVWIWYGVAEVTDFVGSYGYPSTREDGQVVGVWSGASRTALPVVGTTTWQADVEDWDLAEYGIAPSDTTTCAPYTGLVIGSVRDSSGASADDPRHSCWHLLWEIPVWTLVDTAISATLLSLFTIGVTGLGSPVF